MNTSRSDRGIRKPPPHGMPAPSGAARIPAAAPALRRLARAALAILCGAQLAAGAENPLIEKRGDVDGLERQALVAAPASAAASNAPVVFAFHGHGGTAAFMARTFGFYRLWPEAIVVYMQGVRTPGKLTDPAGERTGWQDTPGTFGDRDLRFFDAALDDLRRDYKVDDRRIYATGYSHGGYFTYLLWAQRADRLAAVAPCAATAAVAGPITTPRPALHLAGTGDRLVKWERQRLTMDRMRAVNGCDAEGVPWAATGALTAVLYPSTNGTPFVAATHPGGHGAPAGAGELIVRFFREH